MAVDGAGAGPDGRPSRYEEVVLGLLRGEGATVLTAGLWLLVTSLFTALFLTFVGWQVWENRALETRGRIGDAQVVRANYEGRGKSLNVVYLSGPVGATAILENPVHRPAAGDVIAVRYDPRHPTHLREADAPIWRWPDFLVTVPPAVAGCLVVPAEWMRFRRRLRERRL
ncbi:MULTISPECIES: hypothetical protein [Micromonospora]|uniref:hypothetical protein n=1 Tax=Micromonospora TaxID=1873 RepID=UPI0007DB0111|nr:hypothetical protein [Micromonospora sp. NBRC 110037]